MHAIKRSKLIAILLSTVLTFAGIAIGTSSASAVTNGCIQSGFQPKNCSGEKTIIPDINDTVNVAVSTSTPEDVGSCTTPTFALNKVVTSGGNSTLTQITNLSSNSTALADIAGLFFTFDSSTRIATVSGTPAAAFSAQKYIILATCSNNTKYAYEFSVTITSGAGVPTITPATQVIDGTKDSVFTATASYTVLRFTSAPTFSISSSTLRTLPTGLSFSTSTGVVSGTPTTTLVETEFTVTADSTDISNNVERATATITITIDDIVNINGGGGSSPEASRKVTICHRTHAVTNPYVRITVDYNSVNRKSGHQNHDEIFNGEHVFKAGIYKRAKDKDWGDIIPKDPSGLNRWQPLNLTPLGISIYNGITAGCPTFDAKAYYNAQREAGVPEKKIKQEIGEIETEVAEAEPTTKKTNVDEVKYTGADKKTQEADNDRVTICHRTNSITNPYRKITVSSSSITAPAGHDTHDEIYAGNEVFDSTVIYPTNRKDWGDIIPVDPTGKKRWPALNWTALGEKIFNGDVAGCGEKTTQEIYNELREEGKSKKEIVKDLESQKNQDDDPKDIDEIQYTGEDPDVKKTEPVEPTVPPGAVVPNQSLSGIVWLDLNRDGLKDPEEPLMRNIQLFVVQPPAAASVRASSLANGVLRSSSLKIAAVEPVFTDANGFYIFPSLGAGDWQVTTTIPKDLSVTYDSEGSAEGKVNTNVPVSGSAFTWVGLVGEKTTVNEALLRELFPAGSPELKLALSQLAEIKAAEKAAAATKLKGMLAYTGTNELPLLVIGLLLLIAGAVGLRLTRRNR